SNLNLRRQPIRPMASCGKINLAPFHSSINRCGLGTLIWLRVLRSRSRIRADRVCGQSCRSLPVQHEAQALIGGKELADQRAEQAGVTAKVITAVASAAWNHMDVSPVYACVDRRVVVCESLVH